MLSTSDTEAAIVIGGSYAANPPMGIWLDPVIKCNSLAKSACGKVDKHPQNHSKVCGDISPRRRTYCLIFSTEIVGTPQNSNSSSDLVKMHINSSGISS